MVSAADLDKYYTNKNVAQKCISLLLKDLEYPAWNYTFIEPSAGAGSFIFDETFVAMDIAPENENVLHGDFLTEWFWEPNSVIYGNPPYGKRNTLSKAFIKRAVSNPCVITVAFLLPAVFKKHTLQSVFPDDWVLTTQEDISPDSFTFEGNPYSIPCVFQVWQRNSDKPNLRAKKRLTFENAHFKIALSGDVFVMGASPTTVKFPQDVKSTNRGYWLQSKLPTDTLIDNFKTVNWKGNSSANGGVYWLTKTELINQYEQHFNLGGYDGQQ